MNAASWSAIAATCAAITSFLMYRIARRNWFEAVRPELVLDEWSRQTVGQGDTEHDEIRFARLRNAGRGSALHVSIVTLGEPGEFPVASVALTQVPILSPDEEKQIDGTLIVWWKNVAADSKNNKQLATTIVIYCLDSAGWRHETRYYLYLVDLSGNQVLANTIAPGVAVVGRRTVARPLWLLRLIGRFRNLRRRAKEVGTKLGNFRKSI